jgi:methylthioribulose-1-phosphate dehydratase
MNPPIHLEEIQRIFFALREIKSEFATKGWFPGTSGNLSMMVGDKQAETFTFAITASGKDKSKQTAEDFLIVNEQCISTEATLLKPSAETQIHAEIYRLTNAKAIFHVHTVYNNLVSEMYAPLNHVPVVGVELIKAFNIWEEDAEIKIPILPNYADIAKIAAQIPAQINSRIPGIVLRNHGVYAWGENAFAAKRHLEAFEFLFEYVYHWNLIHSKK